LRHLRSTNPAITTPSTIAHTIKLIKFLVLKEYADLRRKHRFVLQYVDNNTETKDANITPLITRALI
jgi:hypothetical protein